MAGSLILRKVLCAFVMAAMFVVPVSASNAASPKKYANCDELRAVYPGGVAKSKNWKNKGGVLKNAPVVNAKVYNLNASRDRDKDGLVCEN